MEQKTRDEKGHFVKKPVDSQNNEAMEKELINAAEEHRMRMKIIDQDYMQARKRQRITDWLLLIGMSLWVGYMIGIISIIIFK